ncbi:hypothetical protein Hanom_Chr14g01307941 [Helianthus anomalus]
MYYPYAQVMYNIFKPKQTKTIFFTQQILKQNKTNAKQKRTKLSVLCSSHFQLRVNLYSFLHDFRPVVERPDHG